MRVALLSCNGQVRNAIGKQLVQKLEFFLEQGADVRVFVASAERLHPVLHKHSQIVKRVEPGGPVWDFLVSSDLVIADYPHFYALLHYLSLLTRANSHHSSGTKSGPRIILDYHGVTPVHLWSGPNREILEQGMAQRGLVWCADAALVHSRFTRKELLEDTSYPRQRTAILEYMVEHQGENDHGKVSDAFHSSPLVSHGDKELRKKLGLRKERLLLFVGRFAANKRVPVLIEALALLRDVSSPIHLALVGDDSDLYAAEVQLCRDLTDQRRIARQVHFLGQISDEELSQAYRSADLLVIPSVHEGFCLPVVEAMAAGLPVVAARAGALPETVGPAGLTFIPENSGDLARQIRRVLEPLPPDGQPSQPKHYLPDEFHRVALVAFRFGSDIVGGAETSLRTMGKVLQQAGHHVEVFTTCTRGESNWHNDMPQGTFTQDGLVVHRFPIDVHDRDQHLRTLQAIQGSKGQVTQEIALDYLENSINSSALIEALRQKLSEFDAVIVGPYLFGLTYAVAKAFPAKTLLMPCFHDEPLAHLQIWYEVYGQVGGILYHSPEEQDFAQTQLGLHHPHSIQVGHLLSANNLSPEVEDGKSTENLQLRPRNTVDGGRPYLVYCGRFSTQKNVPLLLDYFEKYRGENPRKFDLLFLGAGDMALPRLEGLKNLGRVDENDKQKIMAGAAALVQLSVNESLSLVALEAWAQGVPVIAHADCEVLAGQISRSQGGRTINDFADFARVLDDLWENPQAWQKLGVQGKAYVRQEYGSSKLFLDRLNQAVHGLKVPLHEHMRRRGREWSARCSRLRWREQFGRFIENILESSPPSNQQRLAIRVHRDRQIFPLGTTSLLLAVQVVNEGAQVAVSDGPGRTRLCWEVAQDGQVAISRQEVSLPGLLCPGHSRPAAIPVGFPGPVGNFQVRIWAEVGPDFLPVPGSEASVDLALEANMEKQISGPLYLQEVAKILAETHRLGKLPEDYLDVTEGWFAGWKRRLKQKLLGNFKKAYVDVLSRQQSQVNQQLLTVVQNLADYCATLEHAVHGLQEKLARLEKGQLTTIPCNEENGEHTD